MKKFLFVLVITISLCLHSFAKEPVFLFNTFIQDNVQLVQSGKHSYCIAGNTIYEIEKKGLIQKAVAPGDCNDAAVYNNNIALATSNGIQLFDTKTNTVTALLPKAVQGNISHIQTDNQNHIWFIKEFEGCFMIDDSSSVMQRIKVPVTYALVYTGNGNMWVGTNVGLYKIPVREGEIVRYAEEGIASNDLPDNLVERLFTDAQSNVWVIMPGHISFIANDSEGEIPDYEHVGKKDNTLYDISAVAGLEKAYLFATAQGILLMQDIKYGDALYTGEIHQTINEKAYLLTDDITVRPIVLKDEAIMKIKTCGSETFFITGKGLWSVNTAKLAHKLSSRFKI